MAEEILHLGRDLFFRILISLVLLIISFVLYKLVAGYFGKELKKRKINKNNYVLMRKALRYVFFVLVLIILVLLWGGNLGNFWISIAGVLGIIAIGFFAVWSVLSNVVTGMILLFSPTFNLDEEIEIISEGIKGRIKSVGLMFVVLEDEKGNSYQVPNNMLMQKAVKVFKK